MVCLLQCSFLEHRQFKVIYRRYASLYFIIGMDIDDDCNELSMLEFIHNIVETLDKYFENVCELDVSTLNCFMACMMLMESFVRTFR